MITLGLTGSIGMGKSTVGDMLKKLGCAVHDSDIAVRQALAPDGNAFEEVAVTFPDAWDKKKHIIKKDVLSEIIFSDKEKREELEGILHPAAQLSQRNFLKRQQALGRDISVLDIPLLFETGAERRVDYTLVASAPYHIQRRRVLSRPGMDEEKFLSILNTQMPDQTKCAYADFVVPTGLGYAYTFKVLQKILREIKNASSRHSS